MKVEIQVRTVLMHAWAEIEHKLAYKNEQQVPKELKRKLSRISAKLEEADEQFEELKNSITDYKEKVTKLLNTNAPVKKDLELNLDSLQSFLDLNFPNRAKHIGMTRELLNEFIKNGITISDLNKSYERVKKYLPEIEKDDYKGFPRMGGWAQVGVARIIMDITNEKYLKSRYRGLNLAEEAALSIKWAKIITQNEKKAT